MSVHFYRRIFFLFIIYLQVPLLMASNLSIGNVVRDEIPLSFSSSIPLPPGHWKIEALYDTEVPLTGGSKSKQTIRNVVLSNTDRDSALVAYIASWTEFANVNWGGGNVECFLEERLRRPFVEVFDTAVDSPVSRCATAGRFVNFNPTVSNSASSANAFVKNNFVPLSSKSIQWPQHAFVVYGNIRKVAGNTVSWWIYIDPFLTGLRKDGFINRMISDRIGSKESLVLSENPVNLVLHNYHEWNKAYLLSLESRFFPSLLGRAKQDARPMELPKAISVPDGSSSAVASSAARGNVPLKSSGESEVFSNSVSSSPSSKRMSFFECLNNPKVCADEAAKVAILNQAGGQDSRGEVGSQPSDSSRLASSTFEQGSGSRARADGAITSENSVTVSDSNVLQASRLDCPADIAVRWNNCAGLKTFPNGDKYFGDFKNDRRHGWGINASSDGTYYVGEWREGERNGSGVRYTSGGAIVESGRWSVGRLVESYMLESAPFRLDVRKLGGDLTEANRLAQSSTVGQGYSDRKPLTTEGGGVELGEHERLAMDRRQAGAVRERVEAERLRVDTGRVTRYSGARERESAEPLELERSRMDAAIPTDRRVALVIGNADYKVNRLDNPVNDATDMAAALRSLGFDVTLLRDATLSQMRAATRKFEELVLGADVALIFYAGHGIEAKGRNYMIPVSADIQREYELDDQAYNAGQWLDMLEGAKGKNSQRVNIVILDACRDNSLTRGWRNSARGLGRMDAPSGTVLVYSTAPGKVAADGAVGQRNSPFTKHLLESLQTPNIPIELVLRETRRRVVAETKGGQVPWEHSSLIGEFVFRVQR